MSSKQVLWLQTGNLKKHAATLAGLALLALVPCNGQGQSGQILINDVSRLNPTYVQGISQVQEVEQLQKLIARALRDHLKVSIAGKRHSQGGHTFSKNALILDMTRFNRILNLDTQRKIITVQSGVTWEQLQDYVNALGLAVKVQQASNIFTVGGSLSVNAHGRDPNFGPVVETVRGFRILRADGTIANVSRTENAELFSLAIGGYGLFGVILDVDLDLTTNEVYEKKYAAVSCKDYPKYFEDHVKGNPEIGLHYAWPSLGRKDFLQSFAVFSFVKTTKRPPEIYKLQRERRIKRNRFLLDLSRKSAWVKDLRWYFPGTFADGFKPRIISRNNAMRPEVKFIEYDSPTDTDILQEYFVPVTNLEQFIDEARNILLREKVNILSITVRYAPKNLESFLSYARQDSFAVVLYINQKLSKRGRENAEKWTRELVDAALANHGTYYLSYQLYPTQQQIRKAYPRLDDFFEKKKLYDPQGLFENTFYIHYRAEKN